MKIYLVTDGDYSDYHIIGAFSTVEQAENVRKFMSASDIEEFELDILGKDNRYNFGVEIYINNAKTLCYLDTSSVLEINQVEKITMPENSNWEWERYRVHVMAENREHAIKIGSDLIAQARALGNG